MMKFSHAVVLFFLSVLSLVVQANCDKCGSNSEYCPCQDAGSLYQSMSSYPENTGDNSMSSNVESDSSIEVVSPGASNTGTDDQIETDSYVVVQPLCHQGGSDSSTQPSAPQASLLYTPETGSSNVASGVVNLGFDRPQRSLGTVFDRSTNPSAPTVSQITLTEPQYDGYASTPTPGIWQSLHENFASIKEQVDQLTRINNKFKKLYNEAASNEELVKIDEENENTQRPDPEILTISLIDQFQINLQIALSTIQANNFRSLVSLVSPVETSHSLEWARGNFTFIYNFLLESLQMNSSNPNVSDYFQHSIQLREQVLQFYSNPEPKESIPFFPINSSTGITQAQAVMNQLVNYFNGELREGVRSFALSYSGIPSPFNHGRLYFFVIEDAAIIISPHFGILISHDIDEAVQYIMNYTLLLAVNGISDKIHISKVKADRSGQ